MLASISRADPVALDQHAVQEEAAHAGVAEHRKEHVLVGAGEGGEAQTLGLDG